MSIKESKVIKSKNIELAIKINPDENIMDFISTYPELVEILSTEYGFHCVNCLFSEFDTLREGAAIHQIEGEDFNDMLKHLEEIVNTP